MSLLLLAIFEELNLRLAFNTDKTEHEEESEEDLEETDDICV